MTAINASRATSGPEPMIIGIGPMNIIVPTLVDPPESTEAKMMTAIPSRVITIPAMSNIHGARVLPDSDPFSVPTRVQTSSFRQEIEDYGCDQRNDYQRYCQNDDDLHGFFIGSEDYWKWPYEDYSSAFDLGFLCSS